MTATDRMVTATDRPVRAARTPGRRPRRWLARIAAVLGAIALALLGTAGPAAAHNVLISSDPADGAVLETAPEAVSFTFDQPIQNYHPVLAVIGPNGNEFADGDPTISGDVISVPMLAGPAGEYRAAYRIVSADGHPVSGQITFTLTESAAGTATGTPTAPAEGQQGSSDAGGTAGNPADTGDADSSGGLSIWLWVAIGVAVVLVVAAVVVALRRPDDDPGR